VVVSLDAGYYIRSPAEEPDMFVAELGVGVAGSVGAGYHIRLLAEGCRVFVAGSVVEGASQYPHTVVV
jgi:hypothetical protein